MTSINATSLVVGRELRESFRRRSRWVVLGVVFLGATAAMVVPGLLDSGTTRYDVAVVWPRGTARPVDFESALRASSHDLDASVRFTAVERVDRARDLVDHSKADVAVVGGLDPAVIVRAGEHATLVAFVRQALATSALRTKLGAAGLGPTETEDVLRTPAARVEEVAVDDSDRRAVASVLSLVLYLVLLTLMIQVASGVATEKTNRVSEVLLAVVRPGSLLFGKVIGVGLVGLAGMVAGAIPVVVKAAAGRDLPAGLGPALAGGAAWIALGLVLYLTIAGALGALVERPEEAGTVITPLSFLLIGSYIFSLSSADSSLGAVLAVFPLTAPILMPTRIALGVTSAPEVIASLAIGVVTVVLVIRVGAAIYRRGIVHTGRRLRLREALRAP